MKRRSSSRDTPPIRSSKRSRSSIGRYEDSSDERITPERPRRRSRVRSPPSPRRYASPTSHREYRSRDVDRSYPSYKVLCVSALHPKASDEVIKDTLYREYRKFGDLSIRISHDLDERLAYVCFRSSEDARDAKRNKPKIILFDKAALVEPVYESRPSESYRSRSRQRSRSLTPDADRYYRSPEHRPPDRGYDRMYGPPPMMPPYRDYRHDVPPMPHHHDYIRGPPMHHGMPPHMPPVPPHHYGPPQHMMHHRFRPPPPHFEKPESKKDKFPNYLQHIPPEDDPLATRTLFAGNLEVNISDEELRRIFGRYGVVEDIDIKRPLPGTGNAYAFVRYQNLDMAHRSKVELSGQYIGKFQCKIGYGKPTPTTRIWVGGLGPWTSLAQLEREFDRFGAIKKIDYAKGDNQAYILYDSIDAATAAVKEMRGFPLGGPDKKLRVDFADVNGPGAASKKHNPPPPPEPEAGGEFRSRDNYSAPYDTHYDSNWSEGEYPYRGYRGGRGGTWDRKSGKGYRYDEEWSGRRSEEYDRYKRSSPEEGRSGSRSPRRSIESEEGHNGLLSGARSLPELAKKSVTTWSGALILKNSLFPAKFHLSDGDAEIIESLMKDEEGKPLLRITQRLRLDVPKLDDVSKRISSSTSHAIFLGMSSTTAPPVGSDDSNVQTRPLRNLVSYLKQKEAAGVISLINKDTEVTGVLYAFPPCPFSADLLKRTAHSLTVESLKEDHLVIVVVRGGTA